ncbi:Archaeal PaREP1/PaREP8 family [Pyrobaculum oguniense TE7]|uniref:Archaeal PaREP1/PaREP8 family n=1 Tax=Pyrobaculum oguniense (strain DSM 13380 / JCM 10595 / TE7) TaxID=698757 RepID=H6QB74_PYROT|nr:Archaeal PaREP1/PaREP8 family [Pyrobaculum oguniense TE7]
MEKAVPRVSTTKVVKLSQMLEDVGYAGLWQSTVLALELHDYHHHGLDPYIALSKFRDTDEVAIAVVGLVREIAKSNAPVCQTSWATAA